MSVDFEKLTLDEMRSWDAAKFGEIELDLRKSLASMRLDIYTAPASNVGKKRNMKRALARLLTVRGEQKKKK